MAQDQMSKTNGALLQRVLGISEASSEVTLDGASMLYFPGTSGVAGPYQGGDCISALLERLSELTDRTLEFTPVRVITDTASALTVVGRVRAVRLGRRLDTGAVHVLSLRSGVLREAWVFHPDQRRVDEFWTD